jgi:hypothetical protein
MDMDRFFINRNIERYRRLACAATTDIERTRLLNLMAQEEDNYSALEKAEGSRPNAGSAYETSRRTRVSSDCQ